ncbi:glutamate receptor 1-like [Pectinophora gossypiella]|uniref:glutamate receptor 1-like n=1 Tax=Pectinophora gossypiella TaxID=13191 RepID=UPI00214E350E|nr:glutamate receptor 1-like [Pectinophora gossypiella]
MDPEIVGVAPTSIHNTQRKTTNEMERRHHVALELVKEMSKIGVRSSTTLETSMYLDHGFLCLIDLDCPDAEEVISHAKSKLLLRSPYRWLAISSRNNRTEAILENAPLLVDSDFVLAETTDDGYLLIELHRPSSTMPIVFTPRGHYNGTLTDTRPHRSLFRRRRDVMGHPLTMSTVIQDSNSTQEHLPKEDRLEPEYDAITKINWSVVKLGFLMLNATPRYLFSHRWGFEVNGTWSGMIDDINSGRADVGTNCFVKVDRLAVVVFTDNLTPFHVRFIFRQPPLSYVTNIFSLPFSMGVWIALVICSIAATGGIYAATKWETKLRKTPNQLDGTVGDALLLTMSAVSQQGCVMEPTKASGRIMVLVLFLTLMALYAAYSANIVVLLQAPSNTIRTLAQLEQSKIKLAANDVDYNHFLYNKDPVRYEICKRVDPEKGVKQFYDINEGIERIRKGLFAFHSIVEPVYSRIENTFLENEKCDLMEIDFMNEFDPFTPVKKDSPYLELLRVVFKQIREFGVQSALNRRLQTPKPNCAEQGAAFSSVGLLDLKPVIFLMLYGIALSIVIVCVEILVHWLIPRRKKPSYNFNK